MDSENLTSGDTAHEPSMADGPGARLRAARQELRLDLAHVAADTRIPLRHLEAIEGDNYEALPSRAYAIGFSRTFAQAVGLDPAEITDMVRAELADGSMRRALPSPGIEPGDPARLLSPARQGAERWLDADFALMGFQPARLNLRPGEGPPHIRLDRAAEFLIGDML